MEGATEAKKIPSAIKTAIEGARFIRDFMSVDGFVAFCDIAYLVFTMRVNVGEKWW